MSELKSCPFCGEEVAFNVINGVLGYTEDWMEITCCLASVKLRMETRPYFSKDDHQTIKHNKAKTKEAKIN